MRQTRSVDDYIEHAEHWQEELRKLRGVLLSAGLEETIKWGQPCYVHNGKNVVGIGGFKSYFGLWFFQGALLSDPDGVLVNAQEGKTKALRQWRFTSGREIRVRAIKAYVKEAVGLVERGKAIKAARGGAIEIPKELRDVFARRKKVKAAFDALSPGCRREYAGYVAEAKRAETRASRVEKIVPMILRKNGLNDRYRSAQAG